MSLVDSSQGVALMADPFRTCRAHGDSLSSNQIGKHVRVTVIRQLKGNTISNKKEQPTATEHCVGALPAVSQLASLISSLCPESPHA